MSHCSSRRADHRAGRLLAGGALAVLIGGLTMAPGLADPAQAAAPYSQDFSTAAGPAAAPDGWTVESTNTTGMRAGWAGWTFHTTDEVIDEFGGGGDRSAFDLAEGIAAVVHSDTNRPESGVFDSTLWAPEYALDGADAVFVRFASHYKQGQAPQNAKLVVRFDAAEAQPVANFDSHRLNESAHYTVDVPAGATTAQFGWSYLQSSNNWFWMIDNVEIAESAPAVVTPEITSPRKPVVAPGATTSVSLGGLRAGQQVVARLGEGEATVEVPGVPAAADDGTVAFDVAIPADQVPATLPLTLTGEGIEPTSLTVTVLNDPGEAANTTEPQLWWDGFDGTAEGWAVDGAWEFMTRAEAVDAYGLDRRHTFTRASGEIAVAETAAGAFDGTLASAPAAVTEGDDLELRFDSHFRVRGGGEHIGTVTVEFDEGEAIELRRMTDEEESAQPRLSFAVPEGATTARVVFDYAAPAAAGSWMIDDVKLVRPLAPLADGAAPEAIVDVFSDVQGANGKLQNQVLPGFRNLPGGRADVLISNGDLTSNGTPAQYDAYFNAYDAGGGPDYGTRISTIGNHEFYGYDGAAAYIERFLDRTGMRDLGVAGSGSPNRGLWGETVVDGKLPVLWIGSESHEYHGGSGPFVEIWDEQYNWLRDRLDHYRETNTPVLLSVHHVFENSVSGSYANLYKREFGDDQERIERLLAGNPNVTVMSSHTHWNPELNDWSVEQRFVPTTGQAPTIINTAAVTTQYGPSGDWGEAGVGGADPAGMRVALYDDRLRATVYGFDAEAQPTEIKSIDIALPTSEPTDPGEGGADANGADADGTGADADAEVGADADANGAESGATASGGGTANGADAAAAGGAAGAGASSAGGGATAANDGGGLAKTGAAAPGILAAAAVALIAAGAAITMRRRSASARPRP